jgi:hypothetical protein
MAILFWISFVINLVVAYGSYYVLKVHNELWAVKYKALLEKHEELALRSQDLSKYAQMLAQEVLTMENGESLKPVVPKKSHLN